MNTTSKKKNWKERLGLELKEYMVNALYLAVYFTVFAIYGRLLLEGYDIHYRDYGFGVIKALILAKVIMIGSIFHLGKWFERYPLIYTTLLKALIFTAWVAIFDLIEAVIEGLIKSPTLEAISESIAQHFTITWVGGAIVVFFTFIPFFVLKELNRKMGEGFVLRLLLERNVSTEVKEHMKPEDS